MAGTRIEPRAETSATAEPDRPAKKMLETMVTWARPPWKWPTRARAKRTRRSVMPPRFMSSPARMKSGTARSENWFMPAKLRWSMIE